MPQEIYIAILVACASVVLITLLLVIVAIMLQSKLMWLQSTIEQNRGEVMALLQEMRASIHQARMVAQHASKSMEDIQQITHTAKGWTDQADRLVNAVGVIVEPPIVSLSKHTVVAGKVVVAVWQALLNRKR